MSTPTPQHIANLVVHDVHNVDFSNLRSVIFDVFSSHFPFSEEKCWEMAERFLKDVADELFQKESESRIEHTPISFDIDEVDGEYYIKAVPLAFMPLLAALKEISDDAFELFCARLIQKIGGEGRVNGGSNDGGIDFVGKDLSLKGLLSNSSIGSRVQLIGQAKHYCDGNQVVLNECRQFIGASIRFKRAMHETHTLSEFQPIVLAFWTTSDFNSVALDFLKEMGVWYLNGITLSALASSVGFSVEEIKAIGDEASRGPYE